MAKDKLQLAADRLEQVLDQIAEVEAELDPLKEEEKLIREELMIGMEKKGYKFVKTTSGLGFGVQERKTLSIKEGMEKDALEWAKKDYPHILTIAKPMMNKILKPMLELPSFIEESVTKYISVRSSEAE